MLTLRRAKQRYGGQRGKQVIWLTFQPRAVDDPLGEGFGSLLLLNEISVAPGAAIRGHPKQNVECLSYVRDGVLAYEDSLGRAGVIQAGEFRRTVVARGVLVRQTNASATDWAHLFQIGLRSSGGRPAEEQKRFSVAERRGGLCLVAATDGRDGSLRIGQNALVYSALLEAGQHLVHDLRDGRRAWLHVVLGELRLLDEVLTSGDGAGLTAERSVSFTALVETEVLLLDIAAM